MKKVVVGQDVSGARRQWGPKLWGRTSLGQYPWGRTSLGQYPWGRTSWGRTSVGQDVVGQNFVGQDVAGAKSLGQVVMGQKVLGQEVGHLLAGALGTTGDFMFDSSTGAGVPLAHWDTTGRLFNRYYVQTYRRVTLS